jgi:hypothetical protein
MLFWVKTCIKDSYFSNQKSKMPLYTPLCIPTPPEFSTTTNGSKWNYFVTICIRCSDGVYIPVRFLVDTGFIGDFRFSPGAFAALKNKGVSFPLEIWNPSHLESYSATGVMSTQPTKMQSETNTPNLIGMKFINKFGMLVYAPGQWKFGVEFQCF